MDPVELNRRYQNLVAAIDHAAASECGICGTIRQLHKLAHEPVFKSRRSNVSPTKPGNVRCMDCRCHGVGCPGMPPGYEATLMKWDK